MTWTLTLPDGISLTAQPESLSVSPTAVSLSTLVPRDRIDRFRDLAISGDLSVNSGFGGQFEVTDTGGRGGTITVEPPTDRRPPFRVSEFFPNSYEERQAAPDRYQVSLTLQRPAPRLDEFAPPTQTGRFELSLATGTLGLGPNQVALISQTGTTAGGQIELTLRLTDAQAAAIIDVPGVPDAVVSRAVADGPDTLVDTTPASRQTVSVSTPPTASLPGTQYLISDWEINWARHGKYEWTAQLSLRR